MRIAFVIYDGMTALDFVGVFDCVVRLKTMGFVPQLRWEMCALAPEITDSKGIRFLPSQVGKSLQGYDMIIVPGGAGSRNLATDSQFLQWLKTAEACQVKVSVCTGALLLGAAGFLKGKKATTHPDALEDLKRLCSSVVEQRVVDDGDVITAGGVTAGIDLGLYLCEKLAGPEARDRIRRQMDYMTESKG